MSLSPVRASAVRTNTFEDALSPDESQPSMVSQVFNQTQSGRAATSNQWQTPESMQKVTLKTSDDQTARIDTQRQEALPPLPEQKIPFQNIEFQCVVPWGPDQRTPDRDQAISRHMKFQSATPNSSVNTIEVFGYKNGSIAIGLSSKAQQQISFKKCVNHLGLKCFKGEEETDEEYVCIALTIENQKAILACIQEHNVFPKDHLNFLNKLVEAQNWSTLEQEQKSTSSSSSSSTQPDVVAPQAESIQEEIPYPGKPAMFNCTQPWAKDSGGVSRFMRFESITEKSLIDVVDVLGYEDGSFAISISVKHPTSSNFHRYFLGLKMRKLNNNEDGDYSDRHLYMNPHKNQRDVLRCLTENNEFPAEQLAFLIRLVETQNWRTVEEENKKPAIDQLS